MGIAAVLTRALSFIGIIIMGIVIRRIGFFKEEDFHVLSKIVLKITLPAAILSSFANKEIDASMLSICLFGFFGGVIYAALAILLNLRASKEKRAFEVQNLTGYNIGNFTLPFVQSFLGAGGVIVTSLFDAGNAIMCLGGAFSIASMTLGGDQEHGFSFKKFVKKLSQSFAFDVYLLMTILALLHIHVPEFVTSFAGIIGNGNAFLAMLMIGVGFRLSGNKEQIHQIARIIIVRYGVAIILALAFYFLLPFDLEVRQALCLLVFSPIGSAAPAFTADLKLDVGLSSAINSISIIISIICIVTVLLLVL